MKLFFQYLRQRKKAILAAVLFCLIFLAAFYLYHLPLAAVLYPSALCALLSGLFFLYDFQRMRKKHRTLHAIRTLTDAMDQSLPRIESIEDADYQQIIRCLGREQEDLKTRFGLRYNEMMEYYTLWAHQIKTPIASMRLSLQNEDSPLSRKLSGDLFRVEQYVEMVLMFLRLDSEYSDYVFREYDLDGILRQAVRKFSTEFIYRKLTLNYEPVNATVITDEKWLSFVLEQVLSNALKYTQSGSITITLNAPKTLCIRDTGIGIAPEDLPRVFQKGYTGYNGRVDKKASGIGLYLCRRVCDNLGHRIFARSVPDVGTSVFIDLAQNRLEVE